MIIIILKKNGSFRAVSPQMKGCGIQDIIKILNLTSNLKSRLLLFGDLCGGREEGRERGERAHDECALAAEPLPESAWPVPLTSALALNTPG